ncbi:MAG TPA: acetate--CoA ligase family protein [Streptosporangiaceae bacterium]|nr:acetate--CoA ligase family protein [Streptosporangiaceae bacterium]
MTPMSPNMTQTSTATATSTATPTSRAAMARALITPERLTEFFAPRSIAMVGASETSGWSRFIVAASSAVGYQGPLLPVHPRHDKVFGRAAVRTLRDLSQPADLAFILAPTEAVATVIEDAAAAGVRNVVVLASGYREAGTGGKELEDELVAAAAGHGIVLLGPNTLGFLNTGAKAAPFALTVPLPLTPGPVGIALQSGALSSALLAFARSQAIGVSTVASLGNEAMITTADVLDYLVADEQTKVICMFLEEIGDPAGFSAAAQRADEAGKPIVAMKVGASQAGQQAALAHTGAVAGDDAVVDAAMRQLNIIRVTSIEDLLTTAALLGYQRWPRGRRMGVLTASGGACDIIADRASAEGIEIPPFGASTTEAIAAHLPSFANARNPLDVTGYVLANARTSPLTAIDYALDAAVNDPGLDFAVFTGFTVPEVRPPDEAAANLLENRVNWLAERVRSSPIPVLPMGMTCTDVAGYPRELLGGHGIHVIGGMELGIQAIGHALRWQDGRGDVRLLPARLPAPAGTASAWAEADARDLLVAAGIPVVPGRVARSADEAAQIARELGTAVALKISSAHVTHKSDIGAVLLNLSGDAAVRAGYEQIVAAAKDHQGGNDVLVTSMRTSGTEVLAGVTMDAGFGPVLAVGLGGIWVELLGDSSLRILPADEAEVRRMLGELRALPVLQGARGGVPADLDVLARVIARIGELAGSLSGMQALEVNPLWVCGDRVEALDVLVVADKSATSGMNGAG